MTRDAEYLKGLYEGSTRQIIDTLSPKINELIYDQKQILRALETIANLLRKENEPQPEPVHSEERSNYLVDKYGERCTREIAGTILGCSKTTISRLCQAGELKTLNHRIEVRSITRYLEREEAKQQAVFAAERKQSNSNADKIDPKVRKIIEEMFKR